MGLFAQTIKLYKLYWLGLIILIICCYVPYLFGQDMEPRAYSAAPIGTNFLGVSYAYSNGEVSLDPNSPVTDIESKINTEILGYVRFFALGEQTANVSLAVPFFDADVSGNVGEDRREVNRTGMGDWRARFAYNLVGSPALSPEEFSKRTPSTTIGTSLTIVAPTGEYNSEHLINIGNNRWAYKGDIGLSQPLGNWFIEGSAGLWLFTSNENFYGGNKRSQDPIGTLQLHTGYNFYPGMWLAANATYWEGGRTSIAGDPRDDKQSSSRYGLTLSVPFSESLSFKIAWSQGLSTRVGGDFDTYIAALQYRWFDGNSP